MATVVTFGGKNIIEPGVYSQIKANVNINPVPMSTGNVLIIDTGEGAGYGGGSGITGDLASGLNSVYTFTSLADFRSFVRGGLLWDLAEYLFIPANGAAGAPQVSLVRAATTTKSSLTYTFTGGGANGGTFKVNYKNEGVVGALGALGDTEVRTGAGALMKVGIVDPTKWFIEFYEGTYKGVDGDGDPYDGVAYDDCPPMLIAKSPEFNNIQTLLDWAATDPSFNARFQKDASCIKAGTGAVVLADYTANSTLKLVAGGSTTYGTTDLDNVLSKIGELDYTFVLSLKSGSNAVNASIVKILYHISQEAEFKKFLVAGGGDDSATYSQSVTAVQTFDSPYAIVAHSGFKIDVPFSIQKKSKSALYHAALVCGRLAGLMPQTPLTFKTLRASQWRHILTKTEREAALQLGILHTRYVPNLGYVVNQGINSLQANTQMINQNGTSAEISIMRVAEQLNKELILNMRPIFVGGNLNTCSPADVKAFVEGYLHFKTATKLQDNLIIKFSNVAVTQIQDTYNVTYNFVPNSPLNKIFVTGFMLDANLSA